MNHAVINTSHNSLFQCLHCGETYDPQMPQPIGAWLALSKWFSDTHAECELTEKGVACTFCLGFGHAPLECPRLEVTSLQGWLDGPDTGVSSKTICLVAMGRHPARESTPRDPDDFGRCRRLIARFPNVASKLPDVASAYPRWAPMVREWDALTELYDANKHEELAKRMDELNKEGER